ncbi:hypothetical protein WN51_07096 [Melipona quadrifasciata]|uniref:DUF7041 domain-containing protein n=1 Tax=Melipona quadrifasciata TaxID=166423 RepID=A0A0M8ZSF4_9HYME|nr:hypothetical protein WN51_07096 [Melipona quadrifasciata]
MPKRFFHTCWLILTANEWTAFWRSGYSPHPQRLKLAFMIKTDSEIEDNQKSDINNFHPTNTNIGLKMYSNRKRVTFASNINFNYPRDSENAIEVTDVIRNPPAGDPYDWLKTAIIERTTDFGRKKLQQLLSQEELGDRKN